MRWPYHFFLASDAAELEAYINRCPSIHVDYAWPHRQILVETIGTARGSKSISMQGRWSIKQER